MYNLWCGSSARKEEIREKKGRLSPTFLIQTFPGILKG